MHNAVAGGAHFGGSHIHFVFGDLPQIRYDSALHIHDLFGDLALPVGEERIAFGFHSQELLTVVDDVYALIVQLNGSTDMTDREDECELGYWIGKPFWGQGMIPEASRALLRHAFEDLGMRAVWCGYYEGNQKSKRVQEKLGFVYQYTTVGLEVTLVNEIRTGHTNLMTKEHWQEVYYGSATD